MGVDFWLSANGPDIYTIGSCSMIDGSVLNGWDTDSSKLRIDGHCRIRFVDGFYRTNAPQWQGAGMGDGDLTRYNCTRGTG
jgi:hypothetical protein